MNSPLSDERVAEIATDRAAADLNEANAKATELIRRRAQSRAADELAKAVDGVIAVADRDTVEFNALRDRLAAYRATQGEK